MEKRKKKRVGSKASVGSGASGLDDVRRFDQRISLKLGSEVN